MTTAQKGGSSTEYRLEQTKAERVSSGMSERQFSEEEVAEIFRQASESESVSSAARGKGMTLAALQEIGREAGLSPEAIARAAQSVGRTASPPLQNQTLLGLPVAVGQSVEVDRPFTDADWERLVSDLRVTFNARGVIRQDGAFRQWTNGNLQALVEPTPTGFRLRLKTMNANARGLIAMGLGGIGISAASALAISIAGPGNPGSVMGTVLLGIIGAGLLGIGGIQLPGWARRRRAQMEEVTARASVDPSLESSERARIGRLPD